MENTPTLLTPRLILRRFTPEDAPALFALLRDEEVNTFLPWFPVKTLEEAETKVEQAMPRLLEAARENCARRSQGCIRPSAGQCSTPAVMKGCRCRSASSD